MKELPADCMDCALSFPRNDSEIWCAPMNNQIGESWEDVADGSRPEWCPLKELPKRFGEPALSDLDYWAMETGFDQYQILAALAGFDSCLNQIEGTEGKDESNTDAERDAE